MFICHAQLGIFTFNICNNLWGHVTFQSVNALFFPIEYINIFYIPTQRTHMYIEAIMLSYNGEDYDYFKQMIVNLSQNINFSKLTTVFCNIFLLLKFLPNTNLSQLKL